MNPSRKLTRPDRCVPCTGWRPSRTARPIISGPAHSVDSNPPSRASAATAPFRDDSANSRNALYRLDFPLPLAPVTTLSRSSEITTRRNDRYPSTATVEITAPE